MHVTLLLETAMISCRIIDSHHYALIADSCISVSLNTQGHDASLYTDPEKFDPDRWSSKSEKPHPFSNLMFGVGSKACYGKNYGVNFL